MSVFEVIAESIYTVVRETEAEVRETGTHVLIEGRRFVEKVGVRVEVEVPRLLESESDVLATIHEFDALAGSDLAALYEREAPDFRRHRGQLREAAVQEEWTSRRIVSVLPAPACPTAVQVLRGRVAGPWDTDAVSVVGFMRSQRVCPNLPIDLLSHLWVGSELLKGARVGGVRVDLLVGSLHVDLSGGTFLDFR